MEGRVIDLIWIVTSESSGLKVEFFVPVSWQRPIRPTRFA